MKQLGPIDPPLPVPEPFNPPRMFSRDMTAPKSPIWRLAEPDIDRVMAWLPQTLRDDWPRLDSDNLRFYLRQMMTDRTTAVFCTENAIGMAYVVLDAFEPSGVVYEKFLRGSPKAEETEKHLIVTAMRDWAQSIKATMFKFNLDSDARMNQTSKGPGTKTVLQSRTSRVIDRVYHVAVFDGKDA